MREGDDDVSPTMLSLSSPLLLRGEGVMVGDAPEEVGMTFAFEPPTRCASPSNVTSAFSLKQLRFAVLNLARTTVPKSGMEKFAIACSSKRGIASPSVTFVYSLDSVAVVQPVAEATVQVEPVKPLMHRQAQVPEERKVEPPF